MIDLTTRNADLNTMRALLTEQRTRALDLVASPAAFRMERGRLVVTGADPLMSEEGVTDPNGTYDLTGIADEGIAEKLGVPIGYLRWMREHRIDLYDGNVNGLLHGAAAYGVDSEVGPFPGYRKNLMLRMFRGDEQGTGVLRAVLSDSYRRIDNLDVLVAALGGIRDAGVNGQVTQCDLTERKMYITVEAPEIAAQAPVLLEGYRDPFRRGGVQRIRELAAREGMGYEPGQEPVLHAGVRIFNSETGDGRFGIAPHLKVRICRNGYTVTADALSNVHLGERQDEGVIVWSEATQRKSLELVAAKAADAVKQFLSGEYLARQVARLSEQAGQPVTDPSATIKALTKANVIPAAMADDVFACFTAGGQLAAGGIMHAVTAAAQMVPDADVAAKLESKATDALALAARVG